MVHACFYENVSFILIYLIYQTLNKVVFKCLHFSQDELKSASGRVLNIKIVWHIKYLMTHNVRNHKEMCEKCSKYVFFSYFYDIWM